MKIVEKQIEHFSLNYPIERLCPQNEALFIDIETTGFTARSSYLYLIGCAYHTEGSWHTIQWLSEAPEEQATVLKAFYAFAQKHPFLIQFNGINFDIPYLKQKCAQLSLPYDFDQFQGADIYRRLFPYKKFLNLLNLKQKTLESFLSISREDIYDGGELIAFYQDYLRHPSQETLSVLLKHNEDDIKGMLEILPMLAYFDAFHFPLTAKKVQSNTYLDLNGNQRMELIIYASLPSVVPREVRFSTDGYYAILDGETLCLRVPVFNEELKYFYSNYKEYYYLPKEDIALHRSVASFVDKEYREPAKASNCYTRKLSNYLREWDASFAPFFKRNYDGEEIFFELTDEMKKDRISFANYASHVLNHLASI